MLFWQAVLAALSRALFNAGRSRAARMAMIAILFTSGSFLFMSVYVNGVLEKG